MHRILLSLTLAVMILTVTGGLQVIDRAVSVVVASQQVFSQAR